MRNAIAILAAFCTLYTLTGCSSSKSPLSEGPSSPQTPQILVPRGPTAWTLRILSTCKGATGTPRVNEADEANENNEANETDPAQCVAKYGFTVSSEGNFQVGPGPQGEARKGQLTQDELESLNALIKPHTTGPQVTTQNHDTLESSSGDSIVTLTLDEGTPQTLITTSGNTINFQMQNASEAKAIFTAISNLAKKYYNLPFPDTCNDQVVLVQSLLDSMNTCTQDSDCSYIDDQLNLIESNSTAALTTDNCSLIRPIIAGNAKMLQNNASQLQEKLTSLGQACGERFIRPDCSQQSTLQLSGMAPVCKEGKCQPKTHSSSLYPILN